MKKIYFLLLIFITPLFLSAQNSKVDRFLTVYSKDSVFNKSRMKGSLGVNMKLNGYYDVFGGLQDSETFNIGNINVFGTDDSGSFKMDMYQTQIKMEGVFVRADGKDVLTVIEFDFWGGHGHMRLRKAFIETDHWQIGQNWNNFGDEDLWPNIMEWEGPPSGIWTRSPHVKYFNTFKNEKWIYEISMEAPIVDYNSLGDLEPLVEEAHQVTPDFTFAIKNKYDWGHIRLSSILRNVKYKYEEDPGSFFGYGLSFSGIYKTERKNNFQFQLVGGKGITAYLTSVAGLGFDGFPTVKEEINATPSIGGWMSYEYFFTPKIHTNVVFGYTYYGFPDMERFILPNDIIPENAVLKGDYFYTHSYGILNLMYEPFERMTIGVELDYGMKDLDINGYINDDYINDNQKRDAMRISFGFMFYI